MMDDKEIQSKILDVLNRARLKGNPTLTEDAVTAVMGLDHQIKIQSELRDLLLEGKIEAQFEGTGPDADRLDVDNYSFRQPLKQ